MGQGDGEWENVGDKEVKEKRKRENGGIRAAKRGEEGCTLKGK